MRSITGPADFREEDRSGRVFRWLLGESEPDVPLIAPYAVAVDGGVVWVADSGARMFYRIDTVARDIDYLSELAGVRFNLPSGIATDSVRGRVYLADAELGKVFFCDLTGKLLGDLSPPGGFRRPAGMTTDDYGRIYVVDALAGELVVFEPSGAFLRRIGSLVAPDGKFVRPLSVGIGPSGEVVVLDALAFRVEIQSGDGRLLSVFGSAGDRPGNFARPRGVAVDSRGRVYVTDAAFDNVQVFDLAGNFLMYFGSAGNAHGMFNLPSGLAVDANDRLFVADSFNRRLQVFQSLE